MIDEICKKEDCAACFACADICPVNAISLKYSENTTQPIIESEKCISCKKCKRVCPVNNPVKKSSIKKAYAVYSLDESTRRACASGGLITQICREFDGIIYGASFTSPLEVSHIRIEDKKDLYKIQGSKYVHSHINFCYRDVQNDLKSGKNVLFTGTPCQIAGLKSYLGKDYANLYTIDIICHGVPERNTLKTYIESNCKNSDKCTGIRFRDEKGWHMTLLNGSKVIEGLDFGTNFYYHGFLEGWTYRESCYNCPYANADRTSDLTAGDFWGVGEPLSNELKKGLSVALVITDKGQRLIDSISEKVFIEERQIQEAVRGNGQLNHPSANSKNAQKFRKLLKKHGADYALKNTVLKKKIVFALRKIKSKG